MTSTLSTTPSEQEPAVSTILAELGFPTGASFLDLIRFMADGDQDAIAVEYLDEKVTYGELLRMVAGAASYLESQGVKRGDHVGYKVTAHPNALATYLGVVTMGAVLVPVYSEIDGDVLQHVLDKYDVSTLIVNPELRHTVEAQLDRLPKLKRIYDVRDSEYADAIKAGADIEPYLKREYPTPADPCLLLSTSGTTGLPKGVLQFGNFCLGSVIAVKKWQLPEFPVKAYICTSWGHGAIQFMTTLSFWTRGSVVLAERFSASRYFDDVKKYGVNYIHPLGTMARMLFNQPPKPSDKDHEVRYCIAPAMPPDLWEAFEERFNVKVYEFYSSTDSSGLTLTNGGKYPPGSAGRPFIEAEAMIVDDDGNPVPDGEVGELLLRPKAGQPVVHYYNDPEASAEKVQNGWVWMGDYFRRDADGNYWFVDRKRDVIRRRGINLAPALIEDGVRKHDAVAEATAIAVPAELGEDEIKVVVVPRDESLTPSALAEHCAEVLPRHMRPRYIEFVDRLPTTPGTERIQRYKLRGNWRNSATWDVERNAYLAGS